MTDNSRKRVDSTDCSLSIDTIQLYNSATVQNVNEALTVLFHVFLLESGFIPKEVSDEEKYQLMPENWNSSKTLKIKYAHYCCPSYICCMTCVPLYNTVSVHGIICDAGWPESVTLSVNANKYLKQKSVFSDVSEVFCNLDDLSRLFKDNFCLPLLNLLHRIGRKPLYGMLGLYDDLKMCLLRYMPVEDVVAMSAVNRSFNSVANSSTLWRYLFQRDFKRTLPDIDTDSDWKQVYKTEYMKKKRRLETRAFRIPHYQLPELFTVGPNYPDDIGIHFDPPFPDIYPPFFTPGLPFPRRFSPY